MNRLERMTAILLFLQEKPRTAREIAAHFEVSRRTVLRDVQALSEMGVPVIAREGAAGGYELPADYSLAPLALSMREAFLLLLALAGIHQAEMPYAAERASLQAKLRALLPAAQIRQAEQLLERVGFEKPSRDQRAPLLDRLVQAAQEGRWLRVEYQSAERKSVQHIFPRQVLMEKGLWYCRAFSLEREEERVYRADRFTTVETAGSEVQFIPPPPAQPYATSSDPRVEVRLTARGAARVESEPHLGAMLERLPDGSGRLDFRCPAAEFEWYARYFSGLAEDAEVIQPPRLREKLAEQGRILQKRYAPPPER